MLLLTGVARPWALASARSAARRPVPGARPGLRAFTALSPAPARGEGEDRLSPKQITARLTGAESARGILDVYRQHGSSFDEINVSTVWYRLGTLSGGRERGRERADFCIEEEPTLSQLLLQTERAAPRLAVRNIGNACYGMSLLGFEPAHATVRQLGVAAIPRIGEFIPPGLADIAWAFATLGIREPQLFEAIARESVQSIGKFSPKNLSNVALAFAKLGIDAPPLFKEIARKSVKRIRNFKPQELANTALAFAKLGIDAPPLFEAIALESKRCISSNTFDPQDLSNTAWAFATLGIRDPKLFDMIARETVQLSGKFTPQDLASTVVAFATDVEGVIHRGALVREATERAVELGSAAFNPDERRQLHHFFLSVEFERPADLLASTEVI
jgi:hypothetical protein